MVHELKDMYMIVGGLTSSIHGHARVVQVVGGGLAGQSPRVKGPHQRVQQTAIGPVVGKVANVFIGKLRKLVGRMTQTNTYTYRDVCV